ncbi:hypothetical protein NHX12_008087 [Muraenolepis orangiensis]|uniref:G-protein coupled receptors family 3 profile domain-containing protein n=1 Tax=Muraenolepis orangiensis TaxID=630683 RepID=A0A9Q0DMD0_9TELE|nr:hypothetical protein NHX12_008087 [Muraenolepis orangiensis]
MSWVSLLLAGLSSRAPSLLLVVMVSRDVGLRVGLEGVQTSMCSRWDSPMEESNQGQDGDVVIGGLFTLHYQPPDLDIEFIKPPHYNPCAGLQIEPLMSMYAMEFAVEEINSNPSILPGVRLSYRILDSCGRHPWALLGAFSLVGGDSSTCESTAGLPSSHVLMSQPRERRAMILSRTLSPLFIPMISYLASCPCLSDRRQYPNFFRTIPSDVYQAKTMARLAIRFKWTWVGAVLSDNDYGRLAIQVFEEEIRESGVCVAFSEILSRETIEEDARRVANTIEHSTARVILIFTWYTDVRVLFLELAKRNVTDRQFLATHGLHSLLSCSQEGSSPRDNSSTCSSPYNITPKELLEHLNKVNFTTPHGETFFFDGADIPAVYDLVNWQTTIDGSLNVITIGHLVGSDLHLNESAIQWSTGPTQVPISVCSESCPPGTRIANRKGEPVCCFDCFPCTDGEVNNETGSHQCRRCPIEFWSNPAHTACIPRKVDFLAFNETMGIILTSAAVSGAAVTTAVFVVFLHHRNTPVVRANNSELSFLLLLSLKLCFLCSLVKTIVVLAAFRSAQPGAGGLMKWFGPGQQRGSVCFYTCIQVVICVVWLSLSPPVPHRDLGFQGSRVNLECAMSSVVGFAVVLGYIGFLACLCLILAFLARKLPDNFNEAKFITFSMLIFCAVWVAFVPAYISSPGKYSVAVEVFAILASSYGLLLCIFAPKCFIILLRPERNTKKHLMGR